MRKEAKIPNKRASGPTQGPAAHAPARLGPPAPKDEANRYLGSDGQLNRKRFKDQAFQFFMEYYLWSEDHNLVEFLSRLERAIVDEALSKLDGHQRNTAKFLGLKNTTLNAKIKRYNSS